MTTYRMRANDTLWSIAAENHISVAALERANPGIAERATSLGIGTPVILPIGPVQGQPPGSGVRLRGGPPAGPGGGIPPLGNPGGPGSPPPPTGTSGSLFDQLQAELQGTPSAERDAYAALLTLFQSYGLGDLAPTILNFLQQGYGSDTITSLLQLTPEYQARFAGNKIRQQNGLQVLNPADYLSAEASYRQILQAGGIDPSFMTQNQYAQWIGKDISPTEMQDRVNMAVTATITAPPELTTAFNKMGINVGDIASMFLNDNTPPPVLQQKLNQAQIIEAGLQSRVPNPTVAYAQQLAQQGVSYSQALSGYQNVAAVLPTANQLSQIYTKQTPYGLQQAEQQYLGSSGAAAYAQQQLGEQETAAFGGKNAVGQKSFTPQAAGSNF